MKKTTKTCILLMLAALLLFCSCSGASSGKTADFDVKAAMDDMLKAAPIDDSVTLGEAEMLDFYGIKAESMKKFAAVMCADGITAKEIVLVQSVSEDAAKGVETKLQDRLNARKNEANGYNPEQYAIISKCEVKRDGSYVRLIISPEAEKLISIYNKYLSGK